VGVTIVDVMESIEKPEEFPVPAEVVREIEHFLSGRECEKSRSIEDEQGLQFFEVITKDIEGDKCVITYIRKGNYDTNRYATSTSIEAGYYIGDVPVGGDTLAEWINGRWERKAELR
jgi:hypothetical protein